MNISPVTDISTDLGEPNNQSTRMTNGLDFRTDMAFAYGEPSAMGPGVMRLVANNPGAYTYKGTNTYLVGSTSLAVIDPGPEDDAHRDAILKAAAGRPITHILITHAHRDHVDGVAALQAATGAKTYAYGREKSSSGLEPDKIAEVSSEFIDLGFMPDIGVSGGDRIVGSDWELSALHTPGHAPDHLCFALADSGIVFSGDHVMAWNTSVIAPPEGRMADYLRSLEVLLERKDDVYLPGHGGRVLKPRRTVKAYLLHRRWREQAILEAVRQGTNTIRQMLPLIYRELDEKIAAAATLSLQAHVEHLAERGLITCDDVSNVDCVVTCV